MQNNTKVKTNGSIPKKLEKIISQLKELIKLSKLLSHMPLEKIQQENINNLGKIKNNSKLLAVIEMLIQSGKDAYLMLENLLPIGKTE